MRLKSRFSAGLLGFSFVFGAPFLAAAPAQASTSLEAQSLTPAAVAAATPCGYLGNTGTNAGNLNANYNHCGSGNVRVQIDYQVGNDFRCVSPGITWIRYQIWNPVTNIFAVGGC